METQTDFKELLASLNSHEVEYLIVGAFALAFYGSPRYTGDLDLLVRATPENADRIVKALADFGFASLDLEREDFLQPEKVIQLGVPPVRIDLLTSITGVTWEQAYAGRAPGPFEGIPAAYIGKEQYLANKRALGRHKDMADIEALGGKK